MHPTQVVLSSTKNMIDPELMKKQILQIDEDLSRPIFEMSLPPVLEYALSIPGNVFGMVPCLMVGPLWMMIVLNDDESSPSSTFSPLLVITCLLSLFYLGSWIEFNRGGNFKILKRTLTNTTMYLVAPFLTTAVCYAQASDDPRLLALSIYPSVMWTLSLAITLILKNSAQRDRPCVKFPELHERKNLVNVPKLLAGPAQAKASFPSGDATGVVCFALPLATIYPRVAGVMVLLACFGRMYFLAHHLLDTIAGCTIACCVHLILTQALGVGMENTQVWHPILSLVVLIVSVKGGKHRYK